MAAHSSLAVIIFVLISFVYDFFGNDFLVKPEVSTKGETDIYASDLDDICRFLDQLHEGKQGGVQTF
jgi:hypothetical protein